MTRRTSGALACVLAMACAPAWGVGCASQGNGDGGGGPGGDDGAAMGGDGSPAEGGDGMSFGGDGAGTDAAHDGSSDARSDAADAAGDAKEEDAAGGDGSGGEAGDAGDAGDDADATADGGDDAGDATADGGDDAGDATADGDDGGDSGVSDATMDVALDAAPDSDAALVCPIGHLVIEEMRSRGVGGGSDEFVELFNPTASPVTLDATWTLEARSTTSASFTLRWTGSGKQIPAYGFYLVVGTAYVESPAADDNLTSGITDATALHLQQSGVTVDTLCYGFDAATITTLEGAGYACAGTPADNSPHDNTGSNSSNVDQSLLRQHCVDTGNNASDFGKNAPATPMDTASPPDP
jgi:hypothetical protein